VEAVEGFGAGAPVESGVRESSSVVDGVPESFPPFAEGLLGDKGSVGLSNRSEIQGFFLLPRGDETVNNIESPMTAIKKQRTKTRRFILLYFIGFRLFETL
jgi:hypothetical protein